MVFRICYLKRYLYLFYMDECLYFIVLFSFGVEFVICLLLLLLLLLTYRTGSDKYFHNKIPIDVYSCPFCPNLILQRFFGGCGGLGFFGSRGGATNTTKLSLANLELLLNELAPYPPSISP